MYDRCCRGRGYEPSPPPSPRPQMEQAAATTPSFQSMRKTKASRSVGGGGEGAVEADLGAGNGNGNGNGSAGDEIRLEKEKEKEKVKEKKEPKSFQILKYPIHRQTSPHPPRVLSYSPHLREGHPNRARTTSPPLLPTTATTPTPHQAEHTAAQHAMKGSTSSSSLAGVAAVSATGAAAAIGLAGGNTDAVGAGVGSGGDAETARPFRSSSRQQQPQPQPPQQQQQYSQQPLYQSHQIQPQQSYASFASITLSRTGIPMSEQQGTPPVPSIPNGYIPQHPSNHPHAQQSASASVMRPAPLYASPPVGYPTPPPPIQTYSSPLPTTSPVYNVDTGSAAANSVRARMQDPGNEGKLSVGIDFGTTFSGVAYGSTRLFAGQIRQILVWPGSYETYRKVPSCILYHQPSPNEEASVLSWGLEAKNTALQPGMVKCEWFKLLLSPESLRSGRPDPRLPPLPHGKDVVDVIADFLRVLWRYAKKQITEEIGSVVDLDSAEVLLTVPAAWDAAGCNLMREAAIRAHLVQSSRGGDIHWRDRLQIVTEPEAGAIHASTLASLHHLRPSQTFLLCDAGGGTVDTAVYKLMGQLSQLEIAEMCVRSGANAGSLFVDLMFEELVRKILKDHPVHLDPPSLTSFMHAFSESDKLDYHGRVDDGKMLADSMYRFNCFNVEDGHDPSVGLEYGELAIPGHVLKVEVFDPIINQVLDLLHHQLSKVAGTRIDAIILVGGFAASEYLYTRVQEEFGASIPVIARPNDCDVATLRGAARYGLGLTQGRKAVSAVITPRSYIMSECEALDVSWLGGLRSLMGRLSFRIAEVKLPAEDVDRYERPHFITINDAGMEVCANRLSCESLDSRHNRRASSLTRPNPLTDLVAKGAVLRKGEKLRSRFCKFVKNANDSTFTAQLYTSDSDELYRYTDEGDATELCRWTVDLAALPSFAQIAALGGGYVEFDLGLSLDSAEVRGVLMSDEGVDCGTATFEFL
ncbi:BQ5605_C006g04207 [Microbotryum silenes-dioicae]|uniref:BQ5605_C006g04207 protein n=1 Tax=Microbotryum silenes-dioicae TaxID=796604 RepID=A0A2X0P236_9BASI|nr:BQ5605_C006g04207 [Microbotryum silenes-dioicae]